MRQIYTENRQKNVSVFDLWVLWTTSKFIIPCLSQFGDTIQKHKQKISILKQPMTQIPTTPQEI